ncbi:MAG: pyruvate kinase alpha/beta domain-containing protein [Anaerolineales bacterium]
MGEWTTQSHYFEHAGRENTDRALELAFARARELSIGYVVVPSTTGATGLKAMQLRRDEQVVVVSHSTGFVKPNQQEMPEHIRQQLIAAGATVVTCQHALGGVGRAVRRKLGTYECDEIIAFALRTFCQGVKVACELSLMAADCGAVPVGPEIVSLGGTGGGVDTALVLRAANTQDLFDLRVLEVICKPRCAE